MINATYATLKLRPETLDTIGVDFASDIEFCTVVNPLVVKTDVGKMVVSMKLIGIKDSISRDILCDKRCYSRAFGIWHDFSHNFALALNNTHDRCFAQSTTTTNTMPNTPDIGFVNFNFTREHIWLLVKKFANLVKHSPRCFIGNSIFPLKFFSRIARACGSHLINSTKPHPQRSRRFTEYRSSQWGYLVSTIIALIDRSLGNLVMLRNLLTNRALDTIRVLLVFNPFQAGIIIWEHFVEISFSEFSFHVSPLTIKYSIKGT